MSTLSTHAIEYLRVHVHHEGVWARVCAPIRSLLMKVYAGSEHAATITVVLLTLGVVIISCMLMVHSASIAASYGAAITENVRLPLHVLPTGM